MYALCEDENKTIHSQHITSVGDENKARHSKHITSVSGGDEKQGRWNQRSVTKHPPAPFSNKISTGWNDKGAKRT